MLLCVIFIFVTATRSSSNILSGNSLWLCEILDADFGKRLESSTGRVATRDIVQFVPMREVQAGGQVTVVQSLLEELPGQFLEYMRTRDIKPRPPQHASAPPAYHPPPQL